MKKKDENATETNQIIPSSPGGNPSGSLRQKKITKGGVPHSSSDREAVRCLRADIINKYQTFGTTVATCCVGFRNASRTWPGFLLEIDILKGLKTSLSFFFCSLLVKSTCLRKAGQPSGCNVPSLDKSWNRDVRRGNRPHPSPPAISSGANPPQIPPLTLKRQKRKQKKHQQM